MNIFTLHTCYCNKAVIFGSDLTQASGLHPGYITSVTTASGVLAELYIHLMIKSIWTNWENQVLQDLALTFATTKFEAHNCLKHHCMISFIGNDDSNHFKQCVHKSQKAADRCSVHL